MSSALRRIAEAMEAEAACVWANVEGAMAAAFVSTATGDDLGRVLAVPRLGGRIVLPRAHAIDPLPVILHLTGLDIVEVGATDACARDELGAALCGVAAAVAVTGRGAPPVPDLVWACRQAGVASVIVARDEGWRGALDTGADLVVLDIGLPAGLVVGGVARVAACMLQARGIGRLFPASEAQVDATLVAVERLGTG